MIQLLKPWSLSCTDLWKTILVNHRLCTQQQWLTFLWEAVVEDCAGCLLAMNHLLEISAFRLGLSSLSCSYFSPSLKLDQEYFYLKWNKSKKYTLLMVKKSQNVFSSSNIFNIFNLVYLIRSTLKCSDKHWGWLSNLMIHLSSEPIYTE